MQYKLHIPFVNRADLLRDAVESLRDIGNIHIWCDGVARPEIGNVTFHDLPPLTFTCVMNMIFQNAWNDDVAFFAHNDCYAQPGRARDLFKFVERTLARPGKWGMIQTTYDVLACFNMAAVRAVGFWDTQFSQYTSDCDYYRRLMLGGWPILPFGGGIEHRGDASNTIKADPNYNRVTQFRQPFEKSYYRFKWGGDVGSEMYGKPFNGD